MQATNCRQQIHRGIAAATVCEYYGITDPGTQIPRLLLVAKTAAEYTAKVPSAEVGAAIDLHVQLEALLQTLAETGLQLQQVAA